MKSQKKPRGVEGGRVMMEGEESAVRMYEGEWMNGLRWGHGTLHGADGHKYIGEWVRDETCGMGRCVWADGRSTSGIGGPTGSGATAR